jgi:hypothetical protein
MKRYLIPTIAVLMILAVTLVAFGQQERRGGGRAAEGRRNISEEERTKMRERFQNMSEEEREKFRSQMRSRGGSGRGGFMGREDQEKAIKTIEAQLAKLKATQTTRPAGGFRDLPEDERAKLMERMMKVRQDRQNALQTIIAQVARLQGRRGPAPEAAEGVQYLIISTSDLKPIQAAAIKEKAKETAQLLQRLIARGSGRRGPGGRMPGGRTPGGRTPGGRTPGSRTPGGQEGAGRQRNR